MLIEATRRAEAAVKEMLAIANDGTATTDEFRDALAVSKTLAGIVSAFQVAGSAVIAGRERHGDGGVEVLSSAAGLSRWEAHRQVKTAEALRVLPGARDAIESGRVSVANAKRLAEAVEKTSADAVESDGDLLAKAESMRPEQFTKEVRRWTVERQGDDGEAEHLRQRARRCVRIWDGDDGMVHLHGQFDTVTGRSIGNRMRAEAARMHDSDKKSPTDSSQRRSFQQCMADALDNLTDASASVGAGKPFADICVVAHVDDTTGRLIAELPDGVRLPASVLEELACNAKLTGVVYDRDGKPIWRAHSVRTATEAQRQILIARYGGCFHCAAHPALCQIHHIKPVSEGGSTKISNMVPVCWDCHNKIHHHRWFIHKSPDGNHTLHPPRRVNYGPAHMPEEPFELRADSELTRAISSQADQQQRSAQRDGRDSAGPPSRAGPAAARAALSRTRAGTSTAPGGPTNGEDGTCPAEEARARTGPSPPESRGKGCGQLFALA